MADTSATLLNLLEIMRRLRHPETGCPWDIEQNFSTIAPYTIEEAYEVAEAIAEEDWDELKSELGDLLFQVVFHAQMATEKGYFGFDDIVAAISDKMIRRHPHVFDDAQVDDAHAQTLAWEEHKAAERAQKADNKVTSVLDGVTTGLPSLTRAIKLQNRAARVGFDWPETAMVLDKIAEETRELSEELIEKQKSGQDNAQKIEEEFGDLLFVYSNLARHLKVDPEEALRKANRKFERRFRHIEAFLREEGKKAEDCSLDELDALWNKVKRAEKAR